MSLTRENCNVTIRNKNGKKMPRMIACSENLVDNIYVVLV